MLPAVPIFPVHWVGHTFASKIDFRVYLENIKFKRHFAYSIENLMSIRAWIRSLDIFNELRVSSNCVTAAVTPIFSAGP